MPRYASPTGLSPSAARLSSRSGSRIVYNVAVLQPRGRVATLPVWALPRSLATTGGIIRLFSLPAGTKMFQFPALAPRFCVVAGLQPVGLSHSEIRASRVICTYTRLFAAYHVLLRLSEPRHPPSALFCFPSSQRPIYINLGYAYFQSYFLPSGDMPHRYFGTLLIVKLYSLVCVNMSNSAFPATASVVPLRPGVRFEEMVENNGFEPLTLCLQSRCSSQLS